MRCLTDWRAEEVGAPDAPVLSAVVGYARDGTVALYVPSEADAEYLADLFTSLGVEAEIEEDRPGELEGFEAELL